VLQSTLKKIAVDSRLQIYSEQLNKLTFNRLSLRTK